MVVGEQVANARCSDAEDSFRSQKVPQDRQQESSELTSDLAGSFQR
jgi:hypothetical protein